MLSRATTVTGLLAWLWCGAVAAGEPDRTVSVCKVAEDFEQTAWAPDQWNNAKGQTSLVGEPAPDVKTARSLKIEAAFSGSGFEHFSAVPVTPMWVPGDAKTVTLRYKISDGRYALKMDFIDGWGREQVGGANLSWDIRPIPSGNWKTETFKIPASWVRPVRIAGITTHNWEARNVKKTVLIQADDIEVETDITGRRSEDRRADDLDARARTRPSPPRR